MVEGTVRITSFAAYRIPAIAWKFYFESKMPIHLQSHFHCSTFTKRAAAAFPLLLYLVYLQRSTALSYRELLALNWTPTSKYSSISTCE